MLKTMMLAFAAVVAIPTMASANDRTLVVVNDGNAIIQNFYASNTGRSVWGYDHLNQYVILPGYHSTVDLDDGTGRCQFDLKVTLSNGLVAERDNVDICAAMEWHISDYSNQIIYP